MSWNHKVLRRVYKVPGPKDDGETEQESFQVCEFYESADKSGWTGPIAPFGESLQDLKWELESMLKAVDRALAGEDPITETGYDSCKD